MRGHKHSSSIVFQSAMWAFAFAMPCLPGCNGLQAPEVVSDAPSEHGEIAGNVNLMTGGGEPVDEQDQAPIECRIAWTTKEAPNRLQVIVSNASAKALRLRAPLLGANLRLLARREGEVAFSEVFPAGSWTAEPFTELPCESEIRRDVPAWVLQHWPRAEMYASYVSHEGDWIGKIRSKTIQVGRP